MCVCVCQLSQLQAELEEEWRGRSEKAAAASREQHRREVSEVSEQREALQQRVGQLQDKVLIPAGRDS
jgi:ubiquinone biosynthesis protein UbiJ